MVWVYLHIDRVIQKPDGLAVLSWHSVCEYRFRATNWLVVLKQLHTVLVYLVNPCWQPTIFHWKALIFPENKEALIFLFHLLLKEPG